MKKKELEKKKSLKHGGIKAGKEVPKKSKKKVPKKKKKEK